MEIVKYFFENINANQFLALIILLAVVFNGIASIIKAYRKTNETEEED